MKLLSQCLQLAGTIRGDIQIENDNKKAGDQKEEKAKNPQLLQGVRMKHPKKQQIVKALNTVIFGYPT